MPKNVTELFFEKIFQPSTTEQELIKLVEQEKFEVNSQNHAGYSPLHYAAEHGYKELTQALLDRNANPNAENDYQKTPLHLAAKQREAKIVKLLLTDKAIPNAQDVDGNTPLHVASRLGHKEVARKLIKKGADLNILNKRGETASQLAKACGHKEVYLMLHTVKAYIAAYKAREKMEIAPVQDNFPPGNNNLEQIPPNQAATEKNDETTPLLVNPPSHNKTNFELIEPSTTDLTTADKSNKETWSSSNLPSDNNTYLKPAKNSMCFFKPTTTGIMSILTGVGAGTLIYFCASNPMLVSMLAVILALSALTACLSSMQEEIAEKALRRCIGYP
jgi:ankyrin repeat protein